jgi:hypothetical protein
LGNGDGTFQTAGNFPAGRSPFSVAVGDFNGDGTLDLAVANFGSNNVSVLLGNGDGTFQAGRNFPAGSRPYSVTVGDFDRDGTLDLAVANPHSNDMSVLLGTGDGTFQTARNVPAGRGPVFVAMGDFNGDSLLDFATVNSYGNTVSVLLGNGDGTFQTARNLPAPVAPLSVAVADFNGDGLLDLAVVCSGGVRVFLGNGDGTFQTTNISYMAGHTPAAVAVADFNGDGWADLAVANFDSNDVSILLNDGNWSGSGPSAAGHPRKTWTVPAAVTLWPSSDFRTEQITLADEPPSPMTGRCEPSRPLDLHFAGQRMTAFTRFGTEAPAKLVLLGSRSRVEHASRELRDLIFANWEDGGV